MSTFVPILILLQFFLSLLQAFEDCPDEFKELSQFESCQCQDSVIGQDIWCPNSEKPKVRFRVQQEAMWIDCHNVDETELRFYLKNMSMGSTVNFVEFKQCPIPTTSYAELSKDMKLTNLKKLWIRYGFSETYEIMAGQFDGLGPSLQQLKIINSQGVQSFNSLAFKGLTDLESLELINNPRLQSFSEGIFLPLSNLVSLEIRQSAIRVIPNDLFNGVQELKQLTLELGTSPKAANFQNNKKLVSVELLNLDALELASNTTTLSLFSHMTDLKNVTISGRAFSNLSENLFANNEKLAFFEWRHDKCAKGFDCSVQPPSFVKNITSLRHFQISASYSRGGITLNKDFFWGCDNLKSVKIIRSRVNSVPSELFRDTKNLLDIDLSMNQIQDLPSTIFHNIHKLKSVRLKKNQIKSIDDAHFSKASKLTFLDLSNNKLTNISKKAFANLNNIEKLDLSNNQIYFDKNTEPEWRAMTSVKDINFSNNNISISYIPESFRTTYTQLLNLNLSQNSIGPSLDIFPDLNFRASEKLFLDLSRNRIKYLSYASAIENLKPNHASEGHDVQIDIRGNPLSCDCHNVDLAMHIRNELSSPVTTWFKYLYKNDITCTDAKSTLALTPLSAMQCIFPSEDLQAECPNQCLCSYAPYQSHQDLKGHILVNCSQTSINESKLFIPKIPNHEDVSNVTLDLTNTKLSSLNRLKNIQGYDRVTGLYVSFNNLTEMMPTTVYSSSTEKAASTLPAKLTRFAFDHNQILYFDYEALKRQVPELEAVWLGGNPYECDCDSSELFKFVTRPGHMAKTSVQDPQSVFLNCKNGPLAISDISDSKEFCIDTKDVIIAIVLPVSLVILLLLMLLVLFLIYRDYIYIWIYSKPCLRNLCCDPEDNFDKKFDVFISYSHEDKDFVEQIVVPKLEDDPDEFKYRCLVHVRDFVPGRSIIEQITEAVDTSSCTLIVLSTSFVESEWACHEFDIAHSRSKIIVVVKGEMPAKEKIPDGLYDYVRTRTYLSWQDPWFWKKLRYALPHKGTAKTRCFQGLFGHRGNRHSDQLHLLQSGRTSQAMSTLTLNPSAPSPDGNVNGLNGLIAVNGRNNSVSPI